MGRSGRDIDVTRLIAAANHRAIANEGLRSAADSILICHLGVKLLTGQSQVIGFHRFNYIPVFLAQMSYCNSSQSVVCHASSVNISHLNHCKKLQHQI